jgi:hypothetical protein
MVILSLLSYFLHLLVPTLQHQNAISNAGAWERSVNIGAWEQIVLVLLLLLFPLVSSAELNLSIDRAEINIEEAFELSISSNSTTSGSIDISPLQQDFEIIDQYKQSRVQIINGNRSQSTTWTYTLVAKQPGTITIPAISIGNETTKTREITVKKGSAQNSNNQDVIVEAKVEQQSVYVQGQFIYVQRLLFAKPFRNNSTLTRPTLKEGLAEVEALGNTPKRTVKRNGRDYSMLTRRFAIIPQKSGKLLVAPTVFSGTMRRSMQRHSNSFGFNPRSRRIRVLSNEVNIEVKPRPKEFTGKDWIVAKDFSLHLSWSTPPDQLKAGDPVTVVLAAIANGLHAEQLPEINLQAPNEIKLYPEKPSFNNERNLAGIIGTMNKNIVLVSTGGGEFEIPEISIPWWNSETEQQEIATLEAIQLMVSGSPVPIASQKAITKPELLSKNNIAKEQKSTLSTTLIIMITLACLFFISLLAWLFMQWKNAQNTHQKHAKENYSPAKKQQILTQLKQACDNNNATNAQRQLQQWMLSIELSPTVLTQQNSLEFHQQRQLLNQALYSEAKNDWQGLPLWQVVEKYQAQLRQDKKGKTQKTQQGLEPLYY